MADSKTTPERTRDPDVLWAANEGLLEDATMLAKENARLRREIERLRAIVDSYSAVPFRCDDCKRKLTVKEVVADGQ